MSNGPSAKDRWTNVRCVKRLAQQHKHYIEQQSLRPLLHPATTNSNLLPPPVIGASLSNFMLSKDNLKAITENRIKARHFKHLLKSARVDMSERAGYRYRRAEMR
ncbi:hypothetical protein D9619_009519 [Psilocybe cf. subviscida]|uniref:Uncharacterized protein n=1 Tax=Psilocybe cf. subviscida TaxID=2480587 RepID=A0A8H5BLU1_9AGAR|nr:hypothetical protein D9619_009519 [Psilocybe cf. subviscida]